MSENTKFYQALARRVTAYHRTLLDEWKDRHEAAITCMCQHYLPSGSGLDAGPQLDIEQSTGEKLVFVDCDYHHMNDHGYIRWSNHTVIVTSSLQFGFNLKITGRDYRGIKDYLHETFSAAFNIIVAPELT